MRVVWRQRGLAAVRAVAVWLSAAGLLRAGIAPEDTALVVNGGSWVSRSLANEYIGLRGIPDLNVVVLQGIGSHEGLPVDAFRETILGPVLATLDRRRLAGRIDCIVYSADFPTWVDVRPDIGSRPMPRETGTRASLTGLTYLYQGVMARHLDTLDLNANWYARRPVSALAMGREWQDEERDAYRRVEEFLRERARRRKEVTRDPEALRAWERSQWQIVEPLLATLAENHSDQATVVYNLACAQAQQGALDQALATLRRAATAGFADLRHVREDDDLAALRGREDFEALLAELAEWRPAMVSPVAFSGAVGWSPAGQPVPPYKGARYLLCSLLGVTSGRGNSYAEAVDCLRRAAAADGSRPAGTIWFMDNRDVRSTARQWAVNAAADLVRANGVLAERGAGVLPRGREDVAGLMTGAASFSWEASGSRILPGAVCENLTSFGGVLDEGAGQTPLTEFIRHGAAASSGTVCEPLAIQAKFPTAFLQGYYTGGYSLAESFYLAVTGPYQLLVVGDALCAPWMTPVSFTVSGLQPEEVVDAPLSMHIEGEATAAAAGPVQVRWFVDGVQVGLSLGNAPAVVDPARLRPGRHVLSVVATVLNRVRPCGRRTVPFHIRTQPREAELVAVERGTVRWGEPVTLVRRTAAGEPVTLFWLGREVAILGADAEAGAVPSGELAL
ncbi:MAG: hypothetical protein JXR77_10530, partial [Lentisphaeria bacterium]|nr:hypothetical protein [Lentisphaeria bacterium]